MLRWLLWCERDDQRLVNSARLPDQMGPLEELLASGRDSDTQHELSVSRRGTIGRASFS